MAWLQTRNQIISRALRIIGVVAQGETPSAEQFSEGTTALNALLLSLSVEDIKLWKREWLTKPLSVSSEVLGSDGLNYKCIRSHTASTLTQPVTGAEWTMYWVQDGTAGIPWVDLTAYTSIGDFLIDADALKVMKFMTRLDGTEHDIQMVNYDIYLQQSQKWQTSTYPSYVWLDRGINQRAYLWPQPIDTSTIVHYYADVVMPELANASDNPDTHGKLYDLLSYTLASNLADEYGISLSERQYISGKAERLKMMSRMNDDEDVTRAFMESAY